MHHLAILKKGWLEKILSGEKTIESRWYKSKKTPYKNISTGDTIFLKAIGKPVIAKASVKRVLFFDNLDIGKIIKILQRFGTEIGATVSYADELIGKRYCTLIFLEKIKRIEPFEIDKTGYGNMVAWITVESMDKIKKSL